MTHIVSTYVTQAASTELTLERVLTAGANITITDGGAGGALTIASTSSVTMGMLHEHVIGEDHSGECNGSKVQFITALEFAPEAAQVWLNGLLQRPTHYTEGAFGDTITFSTAPLAGDELVIAYILA